jgi:glycosyltransferase involved in cell wall biosynthesis
MIAIVIPYYKHTYFDETLKSLANQTDKRFKVYIGDDASPESPLALLENYKNEFDFVYHRFEDNFGGISLVKQWERCIDKIEDEDWIMLLGDDDFLGENVIESFYNNWSEILENNISVVRFASNIQIENSELKKTTFIHPKFETISDFYYRKFTGKTRGSLSEYIFEREAYTKKRFTEYPLAWYSDDKAWLDFSMNKPVFSINEAEIYIRVSKHSISGGLNNDEQKETAKFLFFSDLIETELNKFSKETKLLVLQRYEAILKKQKKLTAQDWFYMIQKHVQAGFFLETVKAFRRMLLNLFSK